MSRSNSSFFPADPTIWSISYHLPYMLFSSSSRYLNTLRTRRYALKRLFHISTNNQYSDSRPVNYLKHPILTLQNKLMTKILQEYRETSVSQIKEYRAYILPLVTSACLLPMISLPFRLPCLSQTLQNGLGLFKIIIVPHLQAIWQHKMLHAIVTAFFEELSLALVFGCDVGGGILGRHFRAPTLSDVSNSIVGQSVDFSQFLGY